MAAGHHQKSVRPRSHAYPRFRQTPTGVVQRFIVRVPKGSAALVLQTGLYSRYTKNMVLGLPGDIINGKIAQIKAAWRGAFLAGGHLSDSGQGQLSRNRMSES